MHITVGPIVSFKCCFLRVVLMVVLMSGTLIHAFLEPTDQPMFEDQPNGRNDSPPELVHWSGLLTLIQLAVFSTAFQSRSLPFLRRHESKNTETYRGPFSTQF
mmetsp:Transcript_39954/g.83090  ORF Transcript_39954/g.83090 Transcript_39954/m.83090 type:complete len:103 (+) Transcript_39954:1853-2161(+)